MTVNDAPDQFNRLMADYHLAQATTSEARRRFAGAMSGSVKGNAAEVRAGLAATFYSAFHVQTIAVNRLIDLGIQNR